MKERSLKPGGAPGAPRGSGGGVLQPIGEDPRTCVGVYGDFQWSTLTGRTGQAQDGPLQCRSGDACRDVSRRWERGRAGNRARPKTGIAEPWQSVIFTIGP